MWLTLTSLAFGATLQVGPSRPFPTVQAAVDAATSGDLLEIDAGTYPETVSISGKDLTLRGLGGVILGGSTGLDAVAVVGGVVGFEDLEIDPDSLRRALRVDGGAAVTLTRVVIRDSQPSPADSRGGAVLVIGASTLTVTDGWLVGNGATMSEGGLIHAGPDTTLILEGNTLLEGGLASSAGGAVNVDNGWLEVRGAVRFENNAATTGWGGGIAFSGWYGRTASITGATFSGNAAFLGSDLNHYQGDLAVADCSFNSGDRQVVVQLWNWVATIDRSTFTGATDGALQIFVGQPGTAVRDCDFTANAATWAYGGAIDASGVVEVRDCDFTANTAFSGAAIRAYSDSTVTVIGGVFQDNVATWNGGAIYVDGSERESGNDEDPDTWVTVTGASFTGNTAVEDGGAIAALDAALVVADSTFGFNVAGTAGGAVYLDNDSFPSIDYVHRVDRSTFVGNTSDYGGGYYALLENGDDLDVVDSHFQGNHANLTGAGAVAWNGDRVAFTRDVFCNNTADGEHALILDRTDVAVLEGSVFVDNEAVGARSGATMYRTTRFQAWNNHFVGDGFSADGDAGWSILEGTFANNLVAWDVGPTALSFDQVTTLFEHHNLVYGNAGPFAVLHPTSRALDPQLMGYVPGACDVAGLFPGPGSPLIDAGDPTRFDLDGSRSDIGAFGGSQADPAWWVDGDGDGAVVGVDCDDGDAGVGAATVAWQDLDGDGLGGLATHGCPPVGIAVGGDCDDGDPGVGAATTWYADRDGDGAGVASSPVDLCFPMPGYADRDDDCDDTDPAVHPFTVWYDDADGDGFGAPPGVMQCVPPPGAVVDGTDCNDNDATINPTTVWYLDADQDGYGGALSTVACVAPPLHVRDNSDCDDGDATINPTTPWYPDADFDGYGAMGASPTVTCDPPGFAWSQTSDDCDDTEFFYHPGATWFLDADGDGFGDGAQSVVACVPPADYVGSPGDCDDNDAAIRPDTTFWYDGDGDGWGADGITALACYAPPNFVNQPGDCDDGDPNRNPGVLWYPDLDGDGLGDDAGAEASCRPPTDDHVLVGGDCDDADPTVGVGPTWWRDGDDDGYGDPDAPLVACGQPGGHVANDQDCDDTEAALNPDTAWYPDADGDGYGDPLGNPLVGCAWPGEGTVLDTTDCDDADPRFHPGATDVGGDGLDQDCDGVDAPDDSKVAGPDCGCAQGGGPASSAWVVALVGLAGWRRRYCAK